MQLSGHYTAIKEAKEITCTFKSGENVRAIRIDDTPHKYEGQQVLICLFPIPDNEKGKKINTTIRLKVKNRVLADELAVKFTETKNNNKLSVVTLMKDEDRYLKEWIEYYRIVGADHFYIYDNRSIRRNKIRKILRPYIKQGIVTLVDWDYPYEVNAENTWRYCQRGADAPLSI